MKIICIIYYMDVFAKFLWPLRLKNIKLEWVKGKRHDVVQLISQSRVVVLIVTMEAMVTINAM